MFTVKKVYRDLPAAHRQPTHEGHCRFIHGHNWEFHISFGCDTRDKNGFVIDVGALGFVKDFLVAKFDHTLLLNGDDPLLPLLEQTIGEDDEDGYCAKIVVVQNCGMEGLAQYVFEKVDQFIYSQGPVLMERGVRVLAVTCFEDSKNSACYCPPLVTVTSNSTTDE